MSQDQDLDPVNTIDDSNSFQMKQKYSQFFQKAKNELSKVAQQINSKSYKSIDKTIEEQQQKENYSLSTNHIPQQQIKQNSDNSDESDDEWIEIKITKKPKIKPLPNDQNINNNNHNFTNTERKSYLNTIQSLNAENDKLLQQFNQLKHKFTENNQLQNNDADWKCGQCTLIQNINNNQCVACHSKKPLFESDEKQIFYEQQRHIHINEQNDRLFALELQQKYKTMKDDEKLAGELQKMEEQKAQNMRTQFRNVNHYPARTAVRPMYNSNRSVIGNMLMSVLGVVEVPTHNYNVSNNNLLEFEEKEMNNVSDKWNILPVRLLNENDVLLLHKTEEKKSCPICLVDFKIRDETRQLPCFHLFHRQCIDIWFKQQNGKGKHASCPLDRKKIIDSM